MNQRIKPKFAIKLQVDDLSRRTEDLLLLISIIQFPERTGISILTVLSFDPNAATPIFFKQATHFNIAALNQAEMGKNWSYKLLQMVCE